MQRQVGAPTPESTGFPELNELGRKLEMLRIQRGIAKQHLARHAGTSRQQLWRVMTGKSELTTPLRERLAEVLRVAAGELVLTPAQPRGAAAASQQAPAVTSTGLGMPGPLVPTLVGAASTPLDVYLRDPTQVVRTLATLPSGVEGLRLKRQLLNALEDLALERSVVLSSDFFETRRRVLAGEL